MLLHAMTPIAHPGTLFHLVPTIQVARDALLHPDNKRFVSSSRKGPPGLEVGFHVPSISRGHVITRLGRNADLILHQSIPGNPMSAIHVAFEINPATELIILSVRSKRASSVEFALLLSEGKKEPVPEVSEEKKPEQVVPEGDITGEQITGDGVILYGRDYKISIASYEFHLIWVITDKEPLKTRTVQDYQTSLRLLKDLRSRDRPTENDNSEVLSWHVTRLATAKYSPFKDITHLRKWKGEGSYGKVYEAVDQTSGHVFAIKVVDIEKYNDADVARALLHREIKVMERLNHTHIIEYLGCQHFNTLFPEIFMPLRKGSLTTLAKKKSPNSDNGQLCVDVLGQMLSALDYLASEHLVHRDVKPDNILYYNLPDDGDKIFQLADFGLANHRSLAKTFCGTGHYQAPELWPEKSKVFAPQSPKMDIWSLFATISAVEVGVNKVLPHASEYGIVLDTLRAKASQSFLEPMARLDPDRRASAAQMLTYFFDGKGLTTPRSRIFPIEPEAERAPQANLSPIAGPSNPPQTSNDRGKTPQRPKTSDYRLIVNPPRLPSKRKPPFITKRAGNLAQPAAPLLQPIRMHRHGVTKRLTKAPAARRPPE